MLQTPRLPLDCLRPACLLALMLLTDGAAGAMAQCPSRLSCLLERRYSCVVGTRDCGPCLVKYQEDPGGKCVRRRYRTHVYKEMPEDINHEQIIDFIGNLLKSPKTSKPAVLKAARIGWKINREGLKTPPGGMTTPPEGMKTPSERLKAPPEGLKTPPERIKTTSKVLKTPMQGLETPLEVLKTPPERIKTPSKALKTTLGELKTPPERIKTPSKALKTTLGELKPPSEGLGAFMPLEELKTTSDQAKTALEGKKTYLEASNPPTQGSPVQASANDTGGLPKQHPSAAQMTPASSATASGATPLPETAVPPAQEDLVKEARRQAPNNESVSLTLVVICTLTGISGLLVAALCWYRLQKEVRLAQKMAYTAYKGSRRYPAAERPGDARLAQSVQVHHYQHQKKNLQNLEGSSLKAQQQLSTESEAENEGGEYTVYECPGLAPTGEMEIHNPLFFDSSSTLHAAPCRPYLSLE